MRPIYIAIVTALVFGTSAGAQRQGTVSGVSASPVDEYGAVQFTVRGANPCDSIQIDFGDGTRAATYPIRQLPVTVVHDYRKAGDYAVTVRGTDNYCAGNATMRLRVTNIRPGANVPDWNAPPQSAANVRFPGMDRNNDGVITREEWRGSFQSFSVHDWNRDGRLSGDELRVGAVEPDTPRGANSRYFRGWNQEQFRTLDVNGDGRISRSEWRFDLEDFFRVDRNSDNLLTMNEFVLANDVDDDRGDRFDYLDLDGNNRIDRTEWHGSRAAFDVLDRNNDGWITRFEAQGQNDLLLNRGTGRRETPRTVMVSGQRDWIDTGIDLRVNDIIDVTATGRVYYAPGPDQFGDANGASGRPATPAAPIPYQSIGALVGKVGDNGPFMVGSNLTNFRAADTGRLYLRVNDDRLDDNRGDFRATIVVTRR
jgi:EF hand/PKD domain